MEEYIQTRGATIQQLCRTRGHACEDLTQIGKEDAPWYCGQNNVYLEFQFDSAEYTLSEADRLRTISLIHKLEVCL